MELTNKEAVFNILKTYGCSTSKQIANLVYRDYNISITPTQVSGSIRSLVKCGMAASSKDGYNKTYYWLNNDCFWTDEVKLDDLLGIWRFKK